MSTGVGSPGVVVAIARSMFCAGRVEHVGAVAGRRAHVAQDLDAAGHDVALQAEPVADLAVVRRRRHERAHRVQGLRSLEQLAGQQRAEEPRQVPGRGQLGVPSGGADHRGVDVGEIDEPAIDELIAVCDVTSGRHVARPRQRGVLEMEPLDDAFADDRSPWLAGRLLQDQAEQVVVRVGVRVALARRPGSRLRRGAIEELADLPPAPRVGIDLALVARVGVLGDPAGVVEQHAHRDLARIRESRGHARGQHGGKRIVEGDLPLLDELQRRGGDERLGDAAGPEAIACSHRRGRVDARLPRGTGPGPVPRAVDVERHAREVGLVGLHGAVEDRLQPGADVAGRLARLGVGAGGGGGGRHGEHRRAGQRGDARGGGSAPPARRDRGRTWVMDDGLCRHGSSVRAVPAPVIARTSRAGSAPGRILPGPISARRRAAAGAAQPPGVTSPLS